MLRHILVAFGLILLLCQCKAPQTQGELVATGPKLFDNFGDLHRDIGSKVPAAQRYFDQGLRMTYGFNHEAAGRAFAEAVRLDPTCAICVWGQALVLGSNINMPMPPEAATAATQLAQRALGRAGSARPVDRALIEALALRYADPAPTDRKPLDQAYANAMAEVVRRFPDDDDAAVLYAEALMLLSPWDYWRANGTPAEFTLRLLAELERVLARNPRHIGAMHYYVHTLEMSPTPQRALPQADALAALAPGSGHLVHMPSHIYIRVGRYHDATLINFAAGTADQAFLAVCRGSNEVYLGYVPHNWRFATMTAGLSGSRTLALRAAEQSAKRADPAKPEAAGYMQGSIVALLMTQVRFGQWDAILAADARAATLPYPSAIHHFARGMALARGKKLPAARRELHALEAIAKDTALQEVWVGGSSAHAVLAVAVPLLRGEVALAGGNRKAGLAALRSAVVAEAKLTYYENPDWPLPVRQYLGAALLDAGDAGAAATAYRQDLKTFPDNGWSLYGLAQAQRKLGDTKGAADSERRYRNAWQWADDPLTASRY